jgi:CoA:oxalate CoA-transferase
MLEASLALMSGTASDVLNAGFESRRVGNRSLTNQQANDTFLCSDTHILIAASQTTARNALWKAIGRLDIPADPRFVAMDGMRNNLAALYHEIEKTLATKTAADWEALLIAAGVPCMCVQSVPDSLRQPQITARGLYHRFEDVPGLWPVSVPLTSYKLTHAPAEATTPPPTRRRFFRRPDPQGNNGSAPGLRIPPGPRSHAGGQRASK